MLKRGFQFAPGYRLQEFLGRGQFGQVWRATAPGGAAMAAKFIDLSDGQGQKEYDGIKRVKQIRHAHLMPITAIWLLDGEGRVIEEAPDEAMETIDLTAAESDDSGILSHEVEPSWLVVGMLLGGKSLQQRLRECVDEGLPGIPPRELISYMDESAKGIDYLNSPMHDLGEGPISIQHCDIKPANIVLIGTSAVVCDFGLARILTRNQITATSAAGTPAYMAPEAISGKPSRTSDQYSLAVTYYHLRTGTLPVNDGSLWEVLDAHRQGKLRFGLIAESEQEVLKKATDLNWADRFGSCVEMVEALRESLRAEGHTRPSFIPQSGSMPTAAAATAATQAVDGDPTATMDVQTSPAGESAGTAESSATAQETEAFAVGDHSTRREGFKQQTLPELDEANVAAAPAKSVAQAARKNVRMLTGVVGGFAAMVVLAALAISGDKEPVGDEQEEVASVVPITGADDRGADPAAPVDPETLIAQAMEMVDADPEQAVKLFETALEADPGIAASSATATQLQGHQGWVMQMSLADNQRKLVSRADSATPLLWDLRGDLTPTPLTAHETLLNEFAVSSDGQRLLTGGFDKIARVWNLTASDPSQAVLELEGHSNSIEAVTWRPDQRVAATASADLNLGVWEIGLPTEGNPHGTILSHRLVTVGELLKDLVCDPNGTFLVAKTYGNDPVAPQHDVVVYQWDDLLGEKGTPPPVRLNHSNAKVMAVMHSQPWVITGDRGGSVSLFSAEDGKVVSRPRSTHRADVEAIRVVADGNRDIFVTGAADGTVTRWQSAGKSMSDLTRGFTDPGIGVGAVDLSGDGQWVAAGTNDGSVWLWNSAEVRKALGAYKIATGTGSVDSVVINDQLGLLIAGCSDGVIRMWDLRLVKLLALTDPTPPPSAIENTIEIESTPLS